MPWNDNSDGGNKPTASNNSPWGSGGSGGGNGNGGSPWNRPGGSGGGQGGGSGPDLEEQMRRMQERFSR
ncbi:MAG: FtsH protease activity modulator HflK, partial [Pseudomonadota bacterium]